MFSEAESRDSRTATTTESHTCHRNQQTGKEGEIEEVELMLTSYCQISSRISG